MKDKWALITGASSGIGAATAENLHGLGFNILITARRQERLQKLAQKLGSERVKWACFDIRNPEEIEKFITNHKAELKNLEVLVNCAGLARGTEKVHEAKLTDWDEMIDTNVKGLLHITRGILPFMVEKQSGHIVNLGSVAGRWTYPGGAIYCASKFAVRSFTEGLRMDLLGKNIRVSNVEPGMVNTEFGYVRFGDQKKADEVYKGMKPLSAQDIADTISWIVQRPAHINIQEVVIYPTAQAMVGMVHRNE